ncbi:cation-translocating P-type ATPase [Streptobacillus moniliformis]|uniref:ATPase, P-type (Transporting), HAD superfamily, subfamily IC n=1 Tax=Streptobacillus moniliformis (strain ATCC 14647 / DSM 12112 / NCTC 10651 / 9901) TaxID=519441 RepID=D1AX56_STRM9|nr:cation-translocating P-type ATPase [Streptobacillus moniliformis]ACZ00882.1 ATPase, P-type (transporting), HAD superfamily, subfamily IC [Streptobacillus moniliformis DSM 12112]AVL42730.1 cation-translocating P-type ATPase [Streptobacillus moniliformis]SQA13980.1 Calcium-transporting ATPase lmo0841 [Streptobacillus moniliformis]
MEFKQSIEEVLEKQNVDKNLGLSEEEAIKRLEIYGENKLEETKKKSLISRFIDQLKDVLIYVLIIASILNVIAHYPDGFTEAAIILMVVLINAVVGVVQEAKAEKTLEALKKLSSPKAVVKREGKIYEIDSKYLVPGDILIIDAGRFIPADLRLIETQNLQVEESAFTGESHVVNKDAKYISEKDNIPMGDKINLAYSSTLATYGRGEGVVIKTGMNTEIGKIAKALNSDEDNTTPLQKKLDKLGKTLGYIAIVVCIIIFGLGVLQGRGAVEMMITAVSLAVAAIPEGLIAIVAIVLSTGVTRMSRNKAIVKRLPAVETLGSVNVICSDKTGTLTQNKMTVVRDYSMDNKELLISGLALCSDATETIGDPTEIALVVYANNHGLSKNELNIKNKRVNEFAFDSDRKLMSTLHENGDKYISFTKGAIDNIISLCKYVKVGNEIVEMTDEYRKNILEKSIEMSNDALRVLGLGYKESDIYLECEDLEKDLILVGIVGMIDPPREEVKDSIITAQKAGIKVVMITGDHKNTAVAIAKELNIAKDITESITGPEIDELDKEYFYENVDKYSVFARVSPEHKVNIVEALKLKGNIVSMTGDGVNDAPSLKKADIGVAMGITGTDVSKGAADMILLDDNFTTIVKAVEEGRNIYNNIKKTIMFLLSCNLGEVICIFFATLLGLPIPLVATQLLWINLVTDTLPAISLGLDPGNKLVMDEKPRLPKESFFARGAAIRALIGGTLIGLFTLLAFYIGLREEGFKTLSEIKMLNEGHSALIHARTMAFIVLTVSQLFYSYTMRVEDTTTLKVGLFTNKYLNISFVIGIVLQILLINIPFIAKIFKVQSLGIFDWDIVIILAIIPFIINELIKVFFKFKK